MFIHVHDLEDSTFKTRRISPDLVVLDIKTPKGEVTLFFSQYDNADDLLAAAEELRAATARVVHLLTKGRWEE